MHQFYDILLCRKLYSSCSNLRHTHFKYANSALGYGLAEIGKFIFQPPTREIWMSGLGNSGEIMKKNVLKAWSERYSLVLEKVWNVCFSEMPLEVSDLSVTPVLIPIHVLLMDPSIWISFPDILLLWESSSQVKCTSRKESIPSCRPLLIRLGTRLLQLYILSIYLYEFI